VEDILRCLDCKRKISSIESALDRDWLAWRTKDGTEEKLNLQCPRCTQKFMSKHAPKNKES
jgi:DNA-directed RNA polymerase subunit RPC12/RpoP